MKKVEDYILFSTFILFLLLVLKLFSYFFYSIFWAIILFIILNPLYKKAEKIFKLKESKYPLKRKFVAVILSFLAVLIIVIPILYFIFILTDQFINFYKFIIKFFKEHPDLIKFNNSNKILLWLQQNISADITFDFNQIRNEIIKGIQSFSKFFIANTTIIIKGFGKILISILFMIFTLYFLFVDGEYLKNLFITSIPIEKKYLNLLIEKFNETAYVVIGGYFIVSIFQATVAIILFIIFKVQNAILWGSALFIASFIPLLGASIIWVPISIYMIFAQSFLKGILFFILAGFFISTIDNFLRPMIIKDKIKIHPLLIFFSILGGIRLFNFSGLILGPIILILFFTLLDIFHVVFGEEINLKNGYLKGDK